MLFSFAETEVRFAAFHEGAAGCQETIAYAAPSRLIQVEGSGFAYRPELAGELCGRYQLDFGSRLTGQLLGAVVVNTGRDCSSDPSTPTTPVPEPATIFLLTAGLLCFLAGKSVLRQRLMAK